jgi:hypothetical protein
MRMPSSETGTGRRDPFRCVSGLGPPLRRFPDVLLAVWLSKPLLMQELVKK